VVAIGVVAGVAALGTAYSAYSASQSSKDAQNQNAKNVSDTNALNYQLFLQSRGSQGNALLPMYFQNTEASLAGNALQAYQAEQAALGSPADQATAYQNIVSGLSPSMTAGDTLVNQLFSGELEKQQEANIAPVLAARGQVAAAQKVGILEGLQARLNALSADRARAGYQGGGSAFEKNALTSATIPALQAAGTVGAEADLQNASDVAGIKQQAINTRLNNLSLPLTQAANRIQLAQLPAAGVGQAATQSLTPFNWFKLNPQSFQAQNKPLVTPVPNVGQIAGQAVGSGASTLGNYFAQSAIANQLNQGTSPYVTSTSQNVNYPISQSDQQLIEYYGLNP
jgi:hypothetical protein